MWHHVRSFRAHPPFALPPPPARFPSRYSWAFREAIMCIFDPLNLSPTTLFIRPLQVFFDSDANDAAKARPRSFVERGAGAAVALQELVANPGAFGSAVGGAGSG